MPPPTRPLPAEPGLEPDPEPLSHRSTISAASYFTASEEVSIAAATEGGSVLLLHRFTLIKPGTIAKRLTSSSGGGGAHQASSTHGYGWSALDFFFSSGLLPRGGGAKCDVCNKRLGRKAVLECDDCGLRAHVKCGEVAPRDCGLRASSLTRVASAPQPVDVAPPAAAGGKAKAKLPSPFSQR
jgi:LIM domain kinase 1